MGWVITFGVGGYDTDKPDGNIVSREWFDEPADEPELEELVEE
jgi:hypothetical protein